MQNNNFSLDKNSFASLGLGAGVGIKVGLVNFTFGFSYQAGITDFYKDALSEKPAGILVNGLHFLILFISLLDTFFIQP